MCGIFGVFNLDHPEASKLTTLGLHALQHRGQEAAGIASFNEKSRRFHTHLALGLVSDTFNKPNVLKLLPGNAAVGHTRYSTEGPKESTLRDVQPIFAETSLGGLALAHNGNLTNARTLRKKLVGEGCIFQSTSDTEVIIHLIAKSAERDFPKRLIDALLQIDGAYSLIMLADGMLIGARDPLGVRPLVLGELNGALILASETCALDIIGARFMRDVENGEVIVISKNGIRSLRPFPPQRARPCIFEYIYFSRPDSIVEGKSVYEMRKRMGKELAHETLIVGDVVVPVPDSGVPAAIGYAQAYGLPFELGLIRNHYVGRTFIEPTQNIRDFGVKLKHNANSVALKDKRVMLIDDSIVRGTTAKKIVQMVRDAGAREVHMRSASPPILYPDFYGIDTPEKENLLAAKMSVEEMREFIGADSLAFLSIEGMYRAMGHKERNAHTPQYTDNCFTGDYPIPLTDHLATEQ